MKPLVLLAIVLIVAGVAGLAYGGITYTAKQTTVRLGPVELTAKEKKTIPIPSVAGIVLIAGGVILLLMGTTVRR
ncbi:MAG TPA: DUF3185 domain-containing protein [bacterium]|nr:DUF3185 domain-containing protein [bacterium]